MPLVSGRIWLMADFAIVIREVSGPREFAILVSRLSYSASASSFPGVENQLLCPWRLRLETMEKMYHCRAQTYLWST